MILLNSLLLPLLLVSTPTNESKAPTSILWGPSIDIKLRTEIEAKHQLVAASQSQTRGENTVVSQRRFELKSTQSLSVTDQLIELGPDRPHRWSRFYGGASFVAFNDVGMPNKQTELTKLRGASSLNQASVLFTWVPEDAAYGRLFDQLEVAEETLPGLSAGLNWASLLPPGPVDLGAEWKLEPGVIGELLDCGGDTSMVLEGDKGQRAYRLMRVGVGFNSERLFGATETGSVVAQFVGTEEAENGHQLALIALKIDVEVERDMRNIARMGLPKMESAAGIDVDSAVVTLQLKGSGRLRWDLDSKHLHDMKELKLDERVTAALVQGQDVSDGRVLDIHELVMVGTLYHSIQVIEE